MKAAITPDANISLYLTIKKRKGRNADFLVASAEKIVYCRCNKVYSSDLINAHAKEMNFRV